MLITVGPGSSTANVNQALFLCSRRWRLIELDRQSIRFSLRPVMPFRLDFTVWALRRRSQNAVDLWHNATYCRVLALDDQPVLVSVTQRKTTLNVTVTGEDLSPTRNRTLDSTVCATSRFGKDQCFSRGRRGRSKQPG